MKYLFFILVLLLVSCDQDRAVTEERQSEFETMARDYQKTYMQGSENLDEILAPIDENIQMWENGRTWAYKDMVKFGPHLPNKKVVETFNDQRLLEQDLGYDFVSQLYVGSKGDTLRETVSRIWKRSDDKWKIVYMNNLIHKESN